MPWHKVNVNFKITQRIWPSRFDISFHPKQKGGIVFPNVANTPQYTIHSSHIKPRNKSSSSVLLFTTAHSFLMQTGPLQFLTELLICLSPAKTILPGIMLAHLHPSASMFFPKRVTYMHNTYEWSGPMTPGYIQPMESVGRRSKGEGDWPFLLSLPIELRSGSHSRCLVVSLLPGHTLWMVLYLTDLKLSCFGCAIYFLLVSGLIDSVIK